VTAKQLSKQHLKAMQLASQAPEVRARAVATRAKTMMRKKKEKQKRDFSYLRTAEVRAKATATWRKTMAARGKPTPTQKKGVNINGQIPEATVDAVYGSVLTTLRRVAKSQRVDFEELATRLGKLLADSE